MKKLSDFKDADGAVVVAKLLKPIFGILQNAGNAAAKGKTAIEFASAILQNSPNETMEILAILSETEPENYHCNAVTILRDIVTVVSDEDLMELFGLRRQTPTSSVSASESNE